MMAPTEITKYLHKHIPMTAAMELEVESCSMEGPVVLSAPLGPNINHRQTAFGGSISALSIAAGWTLVHFRLAESGLASRVVIQTSSLEFTKPVEGRFAARCVEPGNPQWDRFATMVEKRGAGRISIRVVLESEGEECGHLAAEYVALRAGEL